jgi:hypothetical protein
LYGCETWPFTLREELRLKVFENRALRRVFGPKRDGVTGEWRKLHSEVQCFGGKVRRKETTRQTGVDGRM